MTALDSETEVLTTLLTWRAQGWRSVLVTVLSTYGASPRPPGCLAGIRQDGLVVGSVSGGCVEDDLIERVRAQADWEQPAVPVLVLLFGQGAEEQARYRLPCNQSLRVAVEFAWDADLLQQALAQLQQGQLLRRRVRWQDGQTGLQPLQGNAPALAAFAEDADGFEVLLGPRFRALLIGANELGRYLAQLLRTLDYAVAVCDPRSEYALAWPMPELPVSSEMPDDWIAALHCDSRCAVLAVAHDPKLDDLALMEALKTPAFYVGALGSQANNAKRRERLLLLGLEAQQVARLHGPIGLDIRARTPAEIAVAIAADLVRLRRQQQPVAAAACLPALS